MTDTVAARISAHPFFAAFTDEQRKALEHVLTSRDLVMDVSVVERNPEMVTLERNGQVRQFKPSAKGKWGCARFLDDAGQRRKSNSSARSMAST